MFEKFKCRKIVLQNVKNKTDSNYDSFFFKCNDIFDIFFPRLDVTKYSTNLKRLKYFSIFKEYKHISTAY